MGHLEEMTENTITEAILELPTDLFVECIGYTSAYSLIGHLDEMTKIGTKIKYLLHSDPAIAKVIRNGFRNSITITCSHIDIINKQLNAKEHPLASKCQSESKFVYSREELVYKQQHFGKLLIDLDTPLVIIESILQRKSYLYYTSLRNDLRVKNISNKRLTEDHYLLDAGLPACLIILISLFNITDLETFQDTFGSLLPFLFMGDLKTFNISLHESLKIIFNESPYLYGIRLASQIDRNVEFFSLTATHNVRLIPGRYASTFNKVNDDYYLLERPEINRRYREETVENLFSDSLKRITDKNKGFSPYFYSSNKLN